MSNSTDAFRLSSPIVKEPAPTGANSYDLKWLDFRGWRSDGDPPAIHVEHFRTKEEADARKRTVRDVEEIVACVTTTPEPRVGPKKSKKFRSDLHLTR